MCRNGRRARRSQPVRRYACSVSRSLVRRAFVLILLALVAAASVGAQTSRTSPKKPTSRPATSKTAPASARPPAPPVREAPLMQCPSILGNGATTQRLYCDVLGGTDPTAGLRVTLPPHAGPLTLSFTLHNRQTYSESEVKAGRAFARYTATLRVVSNAGDVIGQAVVRNEFRTEKDLVERIAGGAGPGGVKAVAPTGVEPVVMMVPEGVEEVILSGERLSIERVGGTEVVTAPGRPYAVVSGVEIEYRPAPPAPPRSKRQRR
jgi:hypothetical protein